VNIYSVIEDIARLDSEIQLYSIITNYLEQRITGNEFNDNDAYIKEKAREFIEELLKRTESATEKKNAIVNSEIRLIRSNPKNKK